MCWDVQRGTVYDYVGKATIWVCVNNDKCKVAVISAIAIDIETGQRCSAFLEKKFFLVEQVINQTLKQTK